MVKLGATLGDASELLRDFFSAGEFASRNGFLQSVNLLLKLTGVFLLICLAVSSGVIFSSLILIFSTLMAKLSKLPLKDYIRRAGIIPLFSLIIALPWIFTTPGKPIFEFIGVSVTQTGLFNMAEFSLRVTACVSTISLFLFTTKSSRLFQNLKSFGILEPLVTIFEITYRYIFTFLSDLRGMLLGRECRVVSDRGIREKWKEGSKIAGNFFSQIIVKSERIHKAMIARGYGCDRKVHPQTPNRTMRNLLFMLLLGSMVGLWILIGL